MQRKVFEIGNDSPPVGTFVNVGPRELQQILLWRAFNFLLGFLFSVLVKFYIFKYKSGLDFFYYTPEGNDCP